jgi:hypothetical protein
MKQLLLELAEVRKQALEESIATFQARMPTLAPTAAFGTNTVILLLTVQLAQVEAEITYLENNADEDHC